MSDFEGWIGKSQSGEDVLDIARSNALNLALGNESPLKLGEPLPLLYHWLYFWDVKPPSKLGSDGHPARGSFLPPVPLPRRMWAGGRLTFLKPLFLGARVCRTSTIVSVKEKSGRTGALCFVTVRHEFDAGQGVAIREEQDLVYRPAALDAPAPAVSAPPPSASWIETIAPDPVLLFRYSALTMNGHRIHYDRPYAMAEEAYPALVVQGPLQATMLVALAERNLHGPILSFDFRGQQPAFDGAPLHICGEPHGEGAEVWTQQGQVRNMVATVRTHPV